MLKMIFALLVTLGLTGTADAQRGGHGGHPGVVHSGAHGYYGGAHGYYGSGYARPVILGGYYYDGYNYYNGYNNYYGYPYYTYQYYWYLDPVYGWRWGRR